MNEKELKEFSITIWKNGTWKVWRNRDAEIAMDDKNWLSHIKLSDVFEDIKKKVKLSPIPEAILRVYRRIFK